jgi:hypothetical protein
VTSKADIARWFRDGVDIGATHMIVVCDTFDYEDYPVYVSPEQKVRKVVAAHQLSAGNMQKVMEVYDLRKDMKEQVGSPGLVFNL